MELFFIVLFFFILFFLLLRKESKRHEQVNAQMIRTGYTHTTSQQILNDHYRDTQHTLNDIKKELSVLKKHSTNLETALEEINMFLIGIPPVKPMPPKPKKPNLTIIKLKKKESKDDDTVK